MTYNTPSIFWLFLFASKHLKGTVYTGKIVFTSTLESKLEDYLILSVQRTSLFLVQYPQIPYYQILKFNNIYKEGGLINYLPNHN